MLAHWEHVVRPLLDAADPSVIVEVGPGRGETTRKLVDWAVGREARVHVIDPWPSFDVSALMHEFPRTLVLHRERSLSALATIERVDVALIDGDHNWYTVLNELRLLDRGRDGESFPLTLVHEVGWPYGRRDRYQDPEAIPAVHRHAYREAGPVPHTSELQEGGLNRRFAHALYENDLRNGVLTAVEDFIEEAGSGLALHTVMGDGGLGIIISPREDREGVRAALERVTSKESLQRSGADLDRRRIAALIALDEEKRALARLERRYDALQRRLSESGSESDRLAAERDTLAAERDRLMVELETVEKDPAELADRLAEQDRRHEDLSRRLEELRHERDSFERRLAEKVGQHERAVRAGRELAAQFAKLEHELDEVRAARDAFARSDRKLSQVLVEVSEAAAEVERASRSRSWRLGHVLMTLLSRLALRRPHGTDALERAAKRLRAVQGRHSGTPLEAPRAEAADEQDESGPEEGVATVLSRVEAEAADARPTGPRAVAVPDLGVIDAGLAAELKSLLTSASVSRDESEVHRELETSASIMRSFRSRLGPKWLDESLEADRRYVSSLNGRASPSPSVMVGTLASGENEFDLCKRSVAAQDHPAVAHVVLSGLPKKEAVAALMERFLESGRDYLVKVDADVVLLDGGFVTRAVSCLEADPTVDLLQIAILDFFSGAPMQGVNVYRRGLEWRSDRQDGLFTDRTFVSPKKRRVVWANLLRAAIHSPDPTPFHAFHFGVHRGLKVSQPGRAERDVAQALEQLSCLERAWDHFQRRRDIRIAHACLGFELTLAGEYGVEDLDYTNPALKRSFERYAGLDAAEAHDLVLSRRHARVSEPRTERLRAARRKIHWQSAAAIRTVLVLLPHFEVFGGVNRQFELAEQVTRLGPEAVVARPRTPSESGSDETLPGRSDYPDVAVLPYPTALRRDWDVVLCADCSGGVMLTMPLFRAARSVVYLFNGWTRRTANVEQVRLVEPDLVVANSSYAARFYQDLAPLTIPGAIDLSVFAPDPAAGLPFRSRDVLRVGAYSGRRKPVKGFGHIVEACRRLHASGVPVELNVYDQLAFELDVPFAFRHHGPLQRQDVRALLSKMDLFISAEEDAGWSNPTVEAMACGVPVICTEAGTTDFALDGETAVVVPFQDPEAIAAAARRLWEHPQEALRLREHALARVRKFDWPVVARRLLDAFGDVPAQPWRRRAIDRRAVERIASL